MSLAARLVLHLVRPAEGGIREHVLTLVGGVDKSRFRPAVAGKFDSYWIERLGHLGINAYFVDLPDRFGPGNDLRCILQLGALFRVVRPDLLHLHGYRAAWLGRIASRLAGGHRQLVSIHNFPPAGPAAAPARWLLARGEGALARHTAAFVTVSEALKQNTVAQLGLPADRVHVIYNAVDLSRFKVVSDPSRIRRELGLPQSVQLVGTAARLCPDKGLDVLVAAARRVLAIRPDTLFVVAGDGPEAASLLRLVNTLGLTGRVRFLGFRADMPRFLAALDVFVLPSRREGLSIAVLEAMAVGRAIVASNVGGIPELLGHNERGRLVPPGDAASLATAITRLLDDEVSRRRLGQKALDHVSRHFGVPTMVASVESLYESILNQGTAGATPFAGSQPGLAPGSAPAGRGRGACDSGKEWET